MKAALVFLALGLLATIEAANVALKVYSAYQDRRIARAKAAVQRLCPALHFDDVTCPRCCPEVALAEAVEAAHAPLSWELARTPEVCAMSIRVRAAFLATARDIDGLGAYVEREWVR